MRYCGQCGATISETAIFCERCGVKLIDIKPKPEKDVQHNSNTDPMEAEPEIEELDLTKLDKDAMEKHGPETKNAPTTSAKKSGEPQTAKQGDNIINLNDILESEEKVEADDSIKREVLADDEIFTKICPMCGEEMEISSKLLANKPVMVKCLKCGQDTKIW